ncbi:MAG TPA: hypothetical protein PKK99_06615 [Bacteroidia bacterium]|nr:hypothetical protein [Bacteroidia bacterium]HNP98708.1 hypothetical protein [Bacteroidia bacterium]
MRDRRRLFIIITSVGVGSLISLYIVKQRLGNLKRDDYIQLGFNFFFAIAVVVGIALLLQHMNKNNPNGPGK